MILETVESAKYLGITISKDLRWHNHICAVAKKCNSTLHFISRNLHDCSRNSRSLAYTTLVRPKLEYCATVWDPHTKKDCDTLEKINRRAARMVFKKPPKGQDVSPTQLLEKLEWKTLEERRKDLRLTMLYRIDNGLVAIPPTRLQEPERKLRGHCRKFQTIRTSSDTVKFSFYPRTIPQWNLLPSKTVTATSVEDFKKKLRQDTEH